MCFFGQFIVYEVYIYFVCPPYISDFLYISIYKKYTQYDVNILNCLLPIGFIGSYPVDEII